AAVAAWSLSDEAEREHNAIESTRWAREAVRLATDDEAGLRRLIALLDRWGDRTGALREYGEFARRLRQEFEVEPAAETRALIDAIRSREEATALAIDAPVPALRPSVTDAVGRGPPTARAPPDRC